MPLRSSGVNAHPSETEPSSSSSNGDLSSSIGDLFLRLRTHAAGEQERRESRRGKIPSTKR